MIWAFRQVLIHRLGQSQGDLRHQLGEARGILVGLLEQDGHGRGPVEGHLPGEGLKGHHGEAVEIGAAVDALAGQQLRRHVLRGAEGQGRGVGVVVGGLHDAEIHHHHPAVGLDHDVAGLDVPVDQLVAVEGAEGVADGVDDPPDLLHGEAAPALEQIPQGAALDELHDQIVGAVLAAHGVDGDQGRVLDGGQGPGLADEAGEGLGIRVGLPHGLDGDGAAQGEIGAPVDHAHAASAHLLLDPVATLQDVAIFEGAVGHLEVVTAGGADRHLGLDGAATDRAAGVLGRRHRGLIVSGRLGVSVMGRRALQRSGLP